MPTPLTDLSAIDNSDARAALDAWQRADSDAWAACFVPGATLSDDGKPRDFAQFSSEIGTEYFTAFDAVREGGLEVDGPFHTDKYGDFVVYFRFVPGPEGRFAGLEIGQTSKRG